MNHAFTNHVQAQTEIYLIKGVHKINKSKIEHIYDKKKHIFKKNMFLYVHIRRSQTFSV